MLGVLCPAWMARWQDLQTTSVFRFRETIASTQLGMGLPRLWYFCLMSFSLRMWWTSNSLGAIRLVAAQFALVGVEPVEDAMPQREGDVQDPLCGIPWCGLVLLLERLVEVGQGFRALLGLVRDPEELPCAGFLLEFDIHSVLADDLGYRALFLARDRFEQTVVVKEFELPEFGADVGCQAVVVVQPSDFGIVEREGIQQRGVHTGVVMDGFSVADEGFQLLPNDLGRDEQLDGFVGGAFLDPLTVLGEFGVLFASWRFRSPGSGHGGRSGW